MSQTNHICVSLDFYGIDRHLESLLLPLVLVRGTPLNTKHRRGEGAGGGSGVAGKGGGKGEGRQIFLRTVHFYSHIYHVGLYMKK